MEMTEEKIVSDYRQAKNKNAQVKILAELNAVTEADIAKILLAHPESGFKSESSTPKRSYNRRASEAAKKTAEPAKKAPAPAPEAAQPISAAQLVQGVADMLKANPGLEQLEFAVELPGGLWLAVDIHKMIA